MNSLQKTYINDSNSAQRADLDKVSFDKLVMEKGRRVILEKAIKCPCKSRSTNQLSSCKNCGGTEWIFVNPIETRMVLRSMDAVTKFEGWSEELRGVVMVTSMCEEEISYMDRITAIDATSIFSEDLQFRKVGTDIFSFTSYPIKEILYIALFVDADTPLQRLVLDTDYTVEDNIIKLTAVYNNYYDDAADICVAIRYKHSPSFHIIELKRETMQSYKLEGGTEKQQNFPVSAYAKRAHYQLDARNFTGDRLVSNSFPTNSCNGEDGKITFNPEIGTPREFQESDPIWLSQKINYFTKIEIQELLDEIDVTDQLPTKLSDLENDEGFIDQSAVDAEALIRANADSTLQDNIDTEETARQSADSTLQTNINSEASTRESADSTLQSNINTEASTRASADNILQSNIDDEETARIAGDSNVITTLRDGVASEADTLQKLYNLILGDFTEVTVANISARNAFNITHLPTNVFVTDDGDGNWALYKATTTGTNATYVKISDPDLLNAVISASQIKTAYESNPDTNAFTNALLSKLNAIEAGATANSTDAFLLNRANHTGTQDASTITGNKTSSFISDFATTVRNTLLTGLSLATNAAISATDTVLSALGKLQKQITDHFADTNNPHSVTKSQVGLGNVDNTSDVNKPVSTAQQTALDLKVDKITGKGLSTEDYTTSEKTKLSGIATGATANSSDATLLARANHTGTQLAATISDFNAAALLAAPAETTTTEGTLISGAVNKATPVDADVVGLVDSAASNILKKLSWANIKATLKTYFDTLYQAALGYTAENAANKDASGGYAGLTLLKINFKNVANTFISFFTNTNTAARTYTFQDRNGTIADDTDMAKVLTGAIGVNLDGQGVVLTIGQKGYVKVPFNCTITAWSIVGDISGSCVFDVWKATGALPTVSNTLIGGGGTKPTLSGATNSSSSSLTGWTTSIATGDIIGWNLDSVSTITRVILQLTITRT